MQRVVIENMVINENPVIVNTQGENVPDWDKFLACCYDADYCTVSDCSFGLHEYGLILGYPDDTEDSYKNKNNFPRMSLISNKFTDTLTRAPRTYALRIFPLSQ